MKGALRLSAPFLIGASTIYSFERRRDINPTAARVPSVLHTSHIVKDIGGLCFIPSNGYCASNSTISPRLLATASDTRLRSALKRSPATMIPAREVITVVVRLIASFYLKRIGSCVTAAPTHQPPTHANVHGPAMRQAVAAPAHPQNEFTANRRTCGGTGE